MFRAIIGSTLEFRFLVLGIAAALAIVGAVQLQKMPVDVFPEFSPPTVSVQTEAIGLSAEEVESLITLNLEELLSGVPWLAAIRSESVTGLSSIVLTFKRGTNIMKARQMIQERLTLAYTLPNVSTPPVILQPVSATSRFMMIGISSDQIDPTELSLLARWTIKPRLAGVPGVANVAIWGQRLRQMHVQIDSNRLHDARMVQEDIIAAAGDALWVSPLTFLKGSAPGTGGWIDNRNQRLGVLHTMPINTPEDMAKVAIASPSMLLSGKTMSLGDVTETTFSHPPLIGDAIVGQSNTGLMLVIEKFPSANTLEVTRGVDRALSELARGLPGVRIDANVFRLATYVEESIANLVTAFAAAGVLVVLVVGLFLRSWRSVLVASAAITASLLAALLLLQLTGATVNTMILAGLVVALPIVISDAVLDAERIIRSHAAQRERASVWSIIYATTLETRSSANYAALIVMLAVVPIFFMGGVSGAFFVPLAASYLLAVAASLLVALTVTPALSMLLLQQSPAAPSPQPRFAASIGERYGRAIGRVIQAPRRVFIGAGVVALVGAASWPLLGHALLPALQERELLVGVATPPGTSHAETYRIVSRLTRELQALPGVRNAGAHVGRAITGDQVVGINSGQVWISIDRQANYDKTVAAIRAAVDGYPGLERNLQHYLRDKVGEVLTGQGNAIVVRLYGPTRAVLRQKAEEVKQALSGIRGIADLRAEGQLEEPQVQVKVNLDVAGRAGVKPGDVRRSSATVFSGLVVGYLFKEQKVYEVLVWGAPEIRNSLNNLSDLWIDKADRTQARLGDVADVSIAQTPTVIRHERIAPYVDVVANTAGRDPAAVVDEVEDRLEKIQFPLEYHPELLGEYVEREKAERHILAVTTAAVIGIFLLLQASFRSWTLALVAFLAVPASVAGSVLAAFTGGGVMSLGSIVGLLAVLGIAARNALLLISQYQHLEERHGMPFGPELVARGTRDCLLPLLASSCAIAAALLPMALLGQVPGLEIVQPLAIVILGGLIASTLLTLFVLPPLYLIARAKTGPVEDIGLPATPA